VNLRIDVTVRAAECAAGYFDGIPSETADCDAATVTNSDDSYTRTVASGATLELPDVTHTDSDGSPVTLPGMVAFVATPCAPGDDAHVLINQTPVIDLGPGETWDLHVEYPDGTQVGSWNAGAERWEIPACPACDPATAVLKNTDGTILDTEEIPSGGSEDIIAPDATAVLKNSEGTTLDTELIPSGVSENIVVADTTIQRKRESGVDIGVTIALPSGTGPHTVTCPNADVTVNNTPFTDVESGGEVDVVVANTDGTKVGSENAGVWEVPDATAVLKNSAGTTLDTEEIPSGGSEDIVVADAGAQLKDSAGTNIGGVEAIPSGVTENITAPDGTVKTTDGGTTVGTVKSNGTASLPQSVIKYKDAADADQVTAASNTEYSGGALRPATQVPRRELTLNGVGTGDHVTLADLIADTVPDVSGGGSLNIVTYTSSGTYTPPANLIAAVVSCVAGGSGGGSGRRGATGTLRLGGQGAPGNGIVRRLMTAAEIGASVAVTVGAGGAGGAAQTTDNTNGNSGSTGGTTSFGALVVAVASQGGGGGTSTSVSTKSAAAYTSFTPAGLPFVTTGIAAGIYSTHGGSSGSQGFGFGALANSGFGRGISAGNANGTNVVTGGSSRYDGSSVQAGVAMGANGLDNVNKNVFDGFSTGVAPATGYGISGGNGDVASNAGHGGLYGAPGGGGGGSTNGTNSGAGGDGAPGACWILEILS